MDVNQTLLTIFLDLFSETIFKYLRIPIPPYWLIFQQVEVTPVVIFHLPFYSSHLVNTYITNNHLLLVISGIAVASLNLKVYLDF